MQDPPPPSSPSGWLRGREGGNLGFFSPPPPPPPQNLFLPFARHLLPKAFFCEERGEWKAHSSSSYSDLLCSTTILSIYRVCGGGCGRGFESIPVERNSNIEDCSFSLSFFFYSIIPCTKQAVSFEVPRSESGIVSQGGGMEGNRKFVKTCI